MAGMNTGWYNPHNSIPGSSGTWGASERPASLAVTLMCFLPLAASSATRRDSAKVEHEVNSTLTCAKTSGMPLSASSIHSLLRGNSNLEQIIRQTLGGNILQSLALCAKQHLVRNTIGEEGKLTRIPHHGFVPTLGTYKISHYFDCWPPEEVGLLKK